MPEKRYLYWDTDVFISYFNGDVERYPVLESILEEIEKSKVERIVTSILTKVEVAWVAHEKTNQALSTEDEDRISEFWANSNVIELIEFNDEIATIARNLMRFGMLQGWKLRTNDAIHLASAQWVGAYEIHTYNLRDFQKFIENIGIDIQNPHIIQPKLF